jgi:predicted transcriptional regulator
MGQPALSAEVKGFINENISSYEDLQVLLLLRDHTGRRVNVVDVAEYLRIEPISAAKHLMNLHSRGLVAHETTRGPYYDYEYLPYPEAQEKRISAVAAAFDRARGEVVDYIFKMNRGQLQSFADAFKVKKDK